MSDTKYQGFCPICEAQLQSDGSDVYCPRRPHYKADKRKFELAFLQHEPGGDAVQLLMRVLGLNQVQVQADVDAEQRKVVLK